MKRFIISVLYLYFFINTNAQTNCTHILKGVILESQSGLPIESVAVFIEGKASKLGLQQMLNEGYKDITEGETGCELVNADFIINVQVGTGTTSENFYTTNSLLDYPTDDLYITTLNGILTGFTGIGLVEISEESNNIKLNTDCEYTLQDKNVKIDVQIVYNVLCLGT